MGQYIKRQTKKDEGKRKQTKKHAMMWRSYVNEAADARTPNTPHPAEIIPLNWPS
jgi:hypothetical protein